MVKNNNQKDLEKEFEKIHNKHPRVRLEKISLVFMSIQLKKEIKQKSTITGIALDTSLKRNAVARCVKYLEKFGYIRKDRIYTPPFLKVSQRNGEVQFIYGKDNRESKISEEVRKLLALLKKENIDPKFENIYKIIKDSKEYNGKFLKSFNTLVKLTRDTFKNYECCLLEIGSGANKYTI